MGNPQSVERFAVQPDLLDIDIFGGIVQGLYHKLLAGINFRSSFSTTSSKTGLVSSYLVDPGHTGWKPTAARIYQADI